MIPATRSLRLLTVGDGDLTFSRALQRRFCGVAKRASETTPGHPVELTATTFVQRDEALTLYRSAADSLHDLEHGGAIILHGVDACKLQPQEACTADLIIFNYPHLGDVPGDCHDPGSSHVQRHQALLAHFLAAARSRCVGPNSQVHVTLCGSQSTLWRLSHAAAAAGLREVQCRSTSDPGSFLFGDIGERLKAAAAIRGTEPQPGWAAPRRWRSGALGDPHWAAKYGYEHKRHDGERTMNVAGSMAFIFLPERDRVSSPTVAPLDDSAPRCRDCGLEFSSRIALDAHLEAPAVPLAVGLDAQPETQCPICCRGFLSESALAAHLTSSPCGSAAKNRLGSSVRQIQDGNAHFGTQDCHSVPNAPRAADSCATAAKWVAEPDNAGERFLHSARRAFPSVLVSKAVAKRVHGCGMLLLNGDCVEETRILKEGDVIELLKRHRDENSAVQIEAPIADCTPVKGVYLIANGSGTGPECSKPTGASWRVVERKCPEKLAVVWKPAGMRSLGEHTGTLQKYLETLPWQQWASSLPPEQLEVRPVSRLEIGCSGVALVALTACAKHKLQSSLESGEVWHIFRAVVHGTVGKEGDVLDWEIPGSGISDGQARDHVLRCRVIEVFVLNPARCTSTCADGQSHDNSAVEGSVTFSVLELMMDSLAGRCCTVLCHHLRQRGTPVAGDRYARKASLAVGGRNASIPTGARVRRGRLQFQCVAVESSTLGLRVRVDKRRDDLIATCGESSDGVAS